MKPATVPGFHTPSFTMPDGGVEHRLFASDGCGWCDKRHSAWRASAIEAPPPKSKLLATDPNEHPSMDRRLDWMPDYPENDEKPESKATDWGKA